MSLIVVTGTSRGLGREMACEFAAAGHTVCGCGRSQHHMQSLQHELGDQHSFQSVDVAKDDEVAAWAVAIQDRFGVPDILINNAALINSNASLWEINAAEFDNLLSVNISGTANTIRHFVPAMVQRQSGLIVNFSSGWGRSVAAHVAPYCATKWAIEGLTQALAAELPDGMAAVPLNPGIINTEMLQTCFGNGASGFAGAKSWAATSVPYILQLSAADNGRSVSVPGF